MAQLKNVKWELFATFIAEGRAIGKSFLDAGYSTASASTHATELKKRPEVVARIAELLEDRTRFKEQYIKPKQAGMDIEPVSVAQLNRAWVLERLMKNADDSAAAQQFTASNQALIVLGKELGLFGTKGDGDDNKKPMLTDGTAATPENILQILGAMNIGIDTTKVGNNDHATAKNKESTGDQRTRDFTKSD